MKENIPSLLFFLSYLKKLDKHLEKSGDSNIQKNILKGIIFNAKYYDVRDTESSSGDIRDSKPI